MVFVGLSIGNGDDVEELDTGCIVEFELALVPVADLHRIVVDEDFGETEIVSHEDTVVMDYDFNGTDDYTGLPAIVNPSLTNEDNHWVANNNYLQ